MPSQRRCFIKTFAKKTVLLNVLPVLVQSGSTNALQLTPGIGRKVAEELCFLRNRQGSPLPLRRSPDNLRSVSVFFQACSYLLVTGRRIAHASEALKLKQILLILLNPKSKSSEICS